VGQSTHPRGRVGRKIRIIYQKSKQEKAYLTPLRKPMKAPHCRREGEMSGPMKRRFE